MPWSGGVYGIVLKCAVSADGFIDPPRQGGERGSLAITSPSLRRLTHHWRAEEGAILVGAGTVGTDDPALNVREAAGPNPLRIVPGPSGRTTADHQVYADGHSTLVVGGPQGLAESVMRLDADGQDALPLLLKDLMAREVRSVLVEGGADTLGRFLDVGLWDELRLCHAPQQTGGGLPARNGPPGRMPSFAASILLARIVSEYSGIRPVLPGLEPFVPPPSRCRCHDCPRPQHSGVHPSVQLFPAVPQVQCPAGRSRGPQLHRGRLRRHRHCRTFPCPRSGGRAQLPGRRGDGPGLPLHVQENRRVHPAPRHGCGGHRHQDVDGPAHVHLHPAGSSRSLHVAQSGRRPPRLSRRLAGQQSGTERRRSRH